MYACLSDTAITRESGFLDFIEPHDGIMADRGFKDLHEDFLRLQAQLYLPPSKSESSQNILEEYRTRTLAAARIHIERFNQRMKTYKFVAGPVAANKTEYLNMAVYVV